MLLQLTTDQRPATDLGYLLHKHPDRVQSFDLPVGVATVFYPEASEERCSAVLLLDVDPVGLVRRGRGARGLADYVNDRPYVASSLLCVAMNRVFKTAMAGTCRERPEVAASAMSLRADLPAVPARGGAPIVQQLFEPLGYDVEVEPVPLDPRWPEWGAGRHVSLTLKANVRLADLLNHLYVLLPVLDDEKHYWIDEAEIEKLLARGEGWLSDHPERGLIVRRYLKHQRSLIFPAFDQLDESAPETGDADESKPSEEDLEEKVSLRDQRLGAVEAVLRSSGARRVLDLGCGPGALLQRLVKDGYTEVVGVDASAPALERAERRLDLEGMSDDRRARIKLLQSPLTYRDRRLEGYDAAVLVEVIEHFDPPRLDTLEQNVFGNARPVTVVVTTPNREYNVRWETLPAGEVRHTDHRFEWTRTEFRDWAEGVGSRRGYGVRFLPVGPEDPEVGPPTQMAVFTR